MKNRAYIQRDGFVSVFDCDQPLGAKENSSPLQSLLKILLLGEMNEQSTCRLDQQTRCTA